MAILSDRADWQIDRLLTHFLAKGRAEAAIKLRRVVALALVKADSGRLVTRAFPSVYVQLASAGLRWFRLPPYWFALEATTGGNVIAAIFYERANIPSRIDEAQDLS